MDEGTENDSVVIGVTSKSSKNPEIIIGQFILR